MNLHHLQGRFLSGYNITRAKLQDFDYQVEVYHKLLETMKFVYGARTRLGDMDFVKDALETAQFITTPAYGAHVRSRTTDRAHPTIAYYVEDPKQYVTEDHGTSHVSVLDEEGNAVSITSTINL